MAHNRPKRILVVDDDAYIRQISSSALLAEGYLVDTAEDGEHGWNTLMNFKGSHPPGYDLLITDNKMPRLSGVELIKKVRSTAMELPVILASGTLPANLESLDLAAVMLKPFFASALIEATQTILEADAEESPEKNQLAPAL
jgi:DNA-binding response OmpR family regulator